jgi:hypothetical protein
VFEVIVVLLTGRTNQRPSTRDEKRLYLERSLRHKEIGQVEDRWLAKNYADKKRMATKK